MCGVCGGVLRLADLGCVSQSVSAPAGTGDSYLRSALGVEGFVMVCVGSLVLRCFQNLMALFGCLEGEGIGLILPCIRCLEFSLDSEYSLQKSNVEFRSGCFSPI